MSKLGIVFDIYRFAKFGASKAELYFYAATAATAHPTTRKAGIRMFSYGIRASGNMTRAAVLGRGPGLVGTTFLRGGSATLATHASTVAMYASAVALGYAVGAVVGTGIAQLGWGDSGARDALDFYTGKVSASQYFSTVGEALGSL